MSVSAAHANAFFVELDAEVWTIEDDGGIPAPANPDGRRAMPFWSRESRAQRVLDTVPAYSGCRPRAIPVAEWTERWLPGLERDGLLVGINWSGRSATGYDLTPAEVSARLGSHSHRG